MASMHLQIIKYANLATNNNNNPTTKQRPHGEAFFIAKKTPQSMRGKCKESLFLYVLGEVDDYDCITVFKCSTERQAPDRSRTVVGNGILIIVAGGIA